MIKFLFFIYFSVMKAFQILNQIGSGSFSKVFKVKRQRDHQVYALKKMKMAQMTLAERKSCMNEIRMLSKICHPNIIQYKEAFLDEKQLCLVMQWAEGGDFLQLMMRRRKQKRPFQPQEISVFVREMANGLAALHKMNIIHRDVKADNFFIGEDNCIKLGDMNVSSISRNGMASTKMGTPFYTSPEIWMQRPYSTATDMWSLGCLLYQMITFQHPFSGRDIAQLKINILKGQLKNLPESCPKELVQIVESCLVFDPSSRLTANDIINNDFIKKNYKEYRNRTMKKDPLNVRERNLTCARLLRQINGFGQSKIDNLPPSKYVSKELSKVEKRNRSTPRQGNKKAISHKMMTVLQIYNQKSTILNRLGTYPPRAKHIR